MRETNASTATPNERVEPSIRPRVFLHVRGAVVRHGLHAFLIDACSAEVGQHSSEAYRDFALRGPVDLLVVDIDEASAMLERLPERKRPRRLLMLSPGLAPSNAAERLPVSTCGLLSVDDHLAHVQDILRRSASCAVTRDARGGCGQCEVPNTLQPQALPLSARELAVFEAMGRGLGASAIAAELGISVKTFESYRDRIKQKLELRSGTDLLAAAVAWRYGYLRLCLRARPEAMEPVS
jgi:DNA-binding NarL/FixJ family response regulator